MKCCDESDGCSEVVVVDADGGPAPSGSLFCGWLRSPSVLMCEEQDWDVRGQATARRICGAGLRYNQLDKSFVLDFGGQKFTISKTLSRLIQRVMPTSC